MGNHAVMRLALVLVFCGLVVAGCGSPKAEVSTFRSPDPAQWRVTEHQLGRGSFLKSNVAFTPQGLTLDMPQGTLNGGELQATSLRGDGTYTARVKASSAQGSISAFFLYVQDVPTDTSDELDFEIPAVPVGQDNRVIVTVWRIGDKTPKAQKTVPLDFDPAAALHEYTFVRDGGDVVFKVDGDEVFRSDQAPTQALRPIFNAWYPTWQDPTVPPAAGTMTVDRYSFTPS
jgi:beta-glucanase (GH16 family)